MYVCVCVERGIINGLKLCQVVITNGIKIAKSGNFNICF